MGKNSPYCNSPGVHELLYAAIFSSWRGPDSVALFTQMRKRSRLVFSRYSVSQDVERCAVLLLIPKSADWERLMFVWMTP